MLTSTISQRVERYYVIDDLIMPHALKFKCGRVNISLDFQGILGQTLNNLFEKSKMWFKS